MNEKTAFKQTAPLASLVGSALLSISAMTYTQPADAAIFKCTESDGSVSYRQSPCPTANQTQKVMASVKTKQVNVDCRIANNFARKTATQMRAGQTSGQVFDFYGGIDALPRTSVGVISYVYSHIGNKETGVDRISALSAARCSTGSYGAVGCDDFPYAFISELGGCEKATQLTMPNTLASVPEKTEQPIVPETTAALGVRTASADGASNNCKQKLGARLSDLMNEMRNGQSAQEQSALQKRKSTLKNQMDDC